jgi:hypothetical protein
MNLEFPCPWCGADTNLHGSNAGSWRFRIPCDLCSREMVVTWDGGLVVSRIGQTLERSDEPTVRTKISSKIAKAG